MLSSLRSMQCCCADGCWMHLWPFYFGYFLRALLQMANNKQIIGNYIVFLHITRSKRKAVATCIWLRSFLLRFLDRIDRLLLHATTPVRCRCRRGRIFSHFEFHIENVWWTGQCSSWDGMPMNIMQPAIEREKKTIVSKHTSAYINRQTKQT